MIELRQVNKIFSTVEGECCVARDLSYQFLPGRSYVIMGPSGVGKSTLLHMIAGFEQPTSGSILVNGVDVAAMACKYEAAYSTFLLRTVGLVFQKPCLIPELNVLENVMLKGLIADSCSTMLHERARDLLRRVGLDGLDDRAIITLSGGQQQRLSVARALMLKPDYVVLDEPTAHVDDITARDMLQVLSLVQQEQGVGIIMTSHDHAVAAHAEVVLTMQEGKLYEKQ